MIKFISELYQDTRFDNHAIAYYKLRDLSGLTDPVKKLVEEVQEYLDVGDAQNTPKLLILDGFDELNNKELQIQKELFEKFNNNLTILVTSRPRYATSSEFMHCFGQHEELYICPFNSQ